MNRRERRKAERRQRSAQRRANRLRRSEPQDDRDDPQGAIAGSRCPECGEPVRWSAVAELLEIDPELVGQIEEVLGPDLLAQADVWTCPACGAAGVVTDEDPYDPDGFDEDPYDPDGFDPDGFDPDELDEPTALDDLFCRACRSPLEWLDPARVASIDKTAYLRAKEQYGADALLDGDAAVCWTCGSITFVPDQGTPRPGTGTPLTG